MPTTLTGRTGLIWGTIDQTDYIIENIEESRENSQEDMDNGLGDIVATAFYGEKGELSMDITPQTTSAPMPTTANLLGRSLAISSDSQFAGFYIVTKASKARKKKGYMTCNISCRSFASTFTTSTSTM